jgi:hypothetical protein
VTARERAMVRALREQVADDDGALEVIDALEGAVRQWLQEMAELASEEGCATM